MNRVLASFLFVLAALIGGPLVAAAASIAVVNFIRGLLLFIPAIFDFSDFRFMVHLIPLAIALGVIYGVFLGVTWLARKSLGPLSHGKEDVGLPGRAQAWMNVLVTLFVAAIALTLILGFGFGIEYSQQLFDLIVRGSIPQAIGLGLLVGMYIPIGFACFTMAVAVEDLNFAGGKKPISASIGLLMPPFVLIIWLIAQAVTGGLFQVVKNSALENLMNAMGQMLPGEMTMNQAWENFIRPVKPIMAEIDSWTILPMSHIGTFEDSYLN